MRERDRSPVIAARIAADPDAHPSRPSSYPSEADNRHARRLAPASRPAAPRGRSTVNVRSQTWQRTGLMKRVMGDPRSRRE